MTIDTTTSAQTASPTGIILFAHGSRDPQWHRPMEAVASRIRETSTQPQVVCAYLELSTPDLPTATQTLLNVGVKTITIVPMFLGMGRHIRHDLPELIKALRDKHPEVVFSLQTAVGENPRLIALLAEIALGKPHA